jgi:peroxiredoxin
MMRLVFCTALILHLATAAQGQATKNHPYQFKVTGVKDTVIYLANYYGERLYYADTARADKAGNFSFKRVPKDREGKFAVVLPGPKYFELIIADGEDIRMESDTTDLVELMKVVKSDNNKVMYDYVRFLAVRKLEREKLLKELEENEGKPEVTARIKMRYNELNDEVVGYQHNLIATRPGLFAVKEIKMSMDIEPPAEIRDDRDKAYYYYKHHYWDNVDFGDDRIVRTPIFHNKLVNYLNKTVIQDPDTIIATFRTRLATKLPKGSEVYKYTVHYTTYNFETSKIMGMDKVFVYMVDTYYTAGDAFWMDEDKIKTIRDKANGKRFTLIGMRAPELILADTSGKWISSHRDIRNRYTLLYFYDPDCGHCKKETPKLVEMYNSYKGDLGVYAVSADNDTKWNKFVRDNKMNFYNVSIPAEAYRDAETATALITSGKTTYQSLKYNETFDVYTTPKVFLLDKDKIIRAKDIAVEQIPEIIKRLDELAPPKQ